MPSLAGLGSLVPLRGPFSTRQSSLSLRPSASLLLASTPSSRGTPEVDYRAALVACPGRTHTRSSIGPSSGHAKTIGHLLRPRRKSATGTGANLSPRRHHPDGTRQDHLRGTKASAVARRGQPVGDIRDGHQGHMARHRRCLMAQGGPGRARERRVMEMGGRFLEPAAGARLTTPSRTCWTHSRLIWTRSSA